MAENETTWPKLDAKVYGEIRKVKDDSVIPPSEYVVFLAKDNVFAEVLPIYRDLCVARGCDDEQVAAVDRLIDRVMQWREHNQDRLKIPDAKGEKLSDLE